MKPATACEVINKTLSEQVYGRLTGEIIFKINLNGGGVRRVICDINNIPSQHFELTEDKASDTKDIASVLGKQ